MTSARGIWTCRVLVVIATDGIVGQQFTVTFWCRVQFLQASFATVAALVVDVGMACWTLH